MAQLDLSRRSVLRSGLAVGAAALIGGGATALPDGRREILAGVSRWNDRVQAAIFDPDQLAPIYKAREITSPFPFNGFYPEGLAPAVDPVSWRLEVAGKVGRQLSLGLLDLRAFDHHEQITRLICIEGWSAVGKWAGPRLSDVLDAAGADPAARFVTLTCADGYWTSIDRPSARHAQTILALDFLDRPLPRAFGAPARLRIPTKLGFKNAKHVVRIEVTDLGAGGYWENQGYGWFAGL